MACGWRRGTRGQAEPVYKNANANHIELYGRRWVGTLCLPPAARGSRRSAVHAKASLDGKAGWHARACAVASSGPRDKASVQPHYLILANRVASGVVAWRGCYKRGDEYVS